MLGKSTICLPSSIHDRIWSESRGFRMDPWNVLVLHEYGQYVVLSKNLPSSEVSVFVGFLGYQSSSEFSSLPGSR